jgi:hypothetical protein
MVEESHRSARRAKRKIIRDKYLPARMLAPHRARTYQEPNQKRSAGVKGPADLVKRTSTWQVISMRSPKPAVWLLPLREVLGGSLQP